jgi:hypothetical protein
MISISDILLVLLPMALGASATLIGLWELEPKKFMELIKAIRTFKKTQK